MSRRPGMRAIRIALLGAALLLPVAGPAPTAAAAPEDDGIIIQTLARYVVEPDDARVRVTVHVTATNVTPDRVSGGVRTSFYFEGLRFPLHDEASGIAARQGGRRLVVSSVERPGFDELTIDLAQRLDRNETQELQFSYDLPAGAPRSGSDIRVGRAFATFPAWAFGDIGRVRVEVPARFDVGHYGDEMSRSRDGATIVYTADVAETGPWVAWIVADDPRGLTRERLTLRDGEAIVVRGWPEDRAWVERVSDVLTRGLPELRALIGLPWPVAGDLEVVEIHSPLLEGYAGLYDPADDEITISEELDDLTIIHEAAHAWFNLALFDERWINEGFAEEFAVRTLDRLRIPRPPTPAVSPDAAAGFPLTSWPPPTAIVDAEIAAREEFGYSASQVVIARLLELTGEDGMRRVIAAAHGSTVAYVGEPRAEPWSGTNGWRRLLDLVEEVGGTDDADELFADWVVTDDERALLARREEARRAYAELIADGDGWHPPYAVRQPMGAWAFDDAIQRIDAAADILQERDRIAADASALGLVVPPGLEAAYEGTAGDGPALVAAADLAEAQAASLDEVARASADVAAARDPLVSIGLLGTAPERDLGVARAAWSDGRLAEATAVAVAVSALLAEAPDIGRIRLVAAIAVVAVLVLAVALAIVVHRRRRTRFATLPQHPPVPAGAAGEIPPTDPAPADAAAEEQGGEPSVTRPGSAGPGDQASWG